MPMIRAAALRIRHAARAGTICVLLAVAPAFAIDGEVLINQAKVNAGGITAGDAPGFPATLSRSGRYKLTGNLAVPADKNGIEVKQHNVTIDFNGFTMSSNPGAAAYGIHATDFNGVRIVNGTVTGFAYAIYGGIYGGALAVVENMRLVSNGTGVVVGQEARIRNNTIASSLAGTGIHCGEQCLIEQNLVSGNPGHGVALTGGRGVLVGNVIVGNGEYGVTSVYQASGYGNNILFGNNGGGAQVTGTVPSQFHPNYCEAACP